MAPLSRSPSAATFRVFTVIFCQVFTVIFLPVVDRYVFVVESVGVGSEFVG